MMQSPWFKLFIWTITTAYFFMMACIIISLFSPGPTEEQAMKFMMGMMNAMSNSTMGLSMAIEDNPELKQIIALSSDITLPIMFLSIVFGFYFRIGKGKNNAG